jgi:protein SCO1/2
MLSTINNKFLVFCIIILLLSCADSNKDKLPYLGHDEIVKGDTMHHKIPPFSFVNQDSITIDNQNLSDYIYVSDFFFTYCPSICPKVKQQMLRIYDKYEKENIIKLVSHTLDPKRDNIETLSNYAYNLGVNNDKWFFLTGDRDEIWDIAEKYFNVAIEDDEAPGGINHSGRIILVDTQGHIRAFANGTDSDDVTNFLKKIDTLIEEYHAE